MPKTQKTGQDKGFKIIYHLMTIYYSNNMMELYCLTKILIYIILIFLIFNQRGEENLWVDLCVQLDCDI